MPDHSGHPGDLGQSIQGLQAQINILETRLQQVLILLERNLPTRTVQQPLPATEVPQAPQPPPKPPSKPTTGLPGSQATNFSTLTTRELAKQSLTLAKKQKLSG